MGRTACCVLLACALVLAGCSGFVGDGPGAEVGGEASDDGGSAASVTPAPVPAATGTERLAPGLTDAGVTSASELAVAHNRVLRDRSFTLRTNRTTTYANGSVRSHTAGIVRVEPNGEAIGTRYERTGVPLIRLTSGSTIVRSERWFGGEQGLAAVAYANGTREYYRQPANDGSVILRSFTNDGERYGRLLSGVETRVTGRVERDGTTLYRVRSSGLSSGLVQFPRFESVGNGTFEGLVGPEGFVYHHRLTYTATTENGSTLRITESRRYEEIGETTVSRPLWYDEALNRTNATDDDR